MGEVLDSKCALTGADLAGCSSELWFLSRKEGLHSPSDGVSAQKNIKPFSKWLANGAGRRDLFLIN